MKVLLLALFVGLVGLSCSKSSSRVEQYTVNGKVTGLGPKIDIHHERIPDYKDRKGEVKGMDSMVMSFAPPPSGGQVAVGDLVRVTFTVHFEEEPGLRIVTLEKLPPDTKLVLE